MFNVPPGTQQPLYKQEETPLFFLNAPAFLL